MQRLMIRAATHSSAQGLYSALSAFNPELLADDEDGWFASVELGSDQNVVEVFDAIQRFVDSRAAGAVPNSVVVALDEREYTIHPQQNRRTAGLGSR
jgi:hypothetical protein